MRTSRWTLPQGAVLLITRRVDRHVFLHRRCSRTLLYPNRWAFFGGGVEAGESPRDAVVRELWEETRMVVAAPVFLWTTVHHKPKGGTGQLTICDHTFWWEYDEQDIYLREGEGCGWCSFDNALERHNVPPHEAHDLRRFRVLMGW
jgi:8-oxo-dGTP pyrophosphatase MutT (NUDIX family)